MDPNDGFLTPPLPGNYGPLGITDVLLRAHVMATSQQSGRPWSTP